MSFTDSPEDLIAKARRIGNTGKHVVDDHSIAVPAPVCVLLLDMARVVESERSNRATTAEIIKQSNIREGHAVHALEHRRRLILFEIVAVFGLGLLVGLLFAMRLVHP